MRARHTTVFPTLLVLSIALAASAAAQDIQTHLKAGDDARCARSTAQALTHLREALAIDSLNYEANWKAARELADSGKMMPDRLKAQRDTVYAEALALARRAVRVDSNGADGHYMVAVAAGRVALTKGPRERVRSAKLVRDEALRAIQLDPQHDGAMHVMGRWNAEIMRLPGITKFFARTFLGASIFSEASWDNAVRYFSDAIHFNDQNIYHHLDLAEALIDADRPNDARPHLERVAQLPMGCDAGDPTYKQQAAALLEKISQR